MKLNSKTGLTLGIASAVLVATAVGSATMAKERKKGPRIAAMFLKGADVDGDKKLSLEEVNVKLDAVFAAADTDRSASLSKVELLSAMETIKEERRNKRNRKNISASKKQGNKSGRRLDRIFANFDTDQNGMIEKVELTSSAGAIFTRMDANGDGFLERAEFRKKRTKKSSN